MIDHTQTLRIFVRNIRSKPAIEYTGLEEFVDAIAYGNIDLVANYYCKEVTWNLKVLSLLFIKSNRRERDERIIKE